MGILTDILRRSRKKEHLQRVKFPIDQRIKEHKPFVLYLGNGADGICYTRIFEERRIAGQELSYGKDSTIYMAYQEIEEDARQVPAVNGFTSTQAEFAGFWVRKRAGGRWLWYIQGEGFLPLSEHMGEKQLFWDGDDIRELLEEDDVCIVLQAQWKHSVTGDAVRNGYSIFSNALMAHAFGAFEGHTYCNTLAAYENGVRNGYRYFEVDLSYTADGRLVCCHGWTEGNCKSLGFTYSPEFQTMKYRQIMSMRVHGQKMMDVRQFYRAMRKRPQDAFEIDFHGERGKGIKPQIYALLKGFSYDTKALDRLVIQVHSKRMYSAIDAVYHFKHYQFLVGNKADDLDAILDFCLERDICVVGMRCSMTTPAMVQKVKNAGLYLMCYTVKQDVDFAKYLLDMGVDTICTDYVTAEGLAEAGNRYGKRPFYIRYLCEPGQAQPDTELCFCRNDGKERIRKNRFEKEGFEFAGWHLQVTIEGTRLWYANDGLYHTGQDFEKKAELEKYLFADEERLPVLTVREGTAVELAAVWKGTD